MGAKGKQSIQDPIVAANRAGNAADTAFLEVVISEVPLSAFINLDPPLAVNRFKPLRLVALVDTLYDYADAEIVGKVDEIKGADDLARIRSNPHYPRMVEAINAAVERVAGATTMDKVAEMMEGRMALSVGATALNAKSARDKLKAGDEVIARRSPKKTRSSGMKNVTNLFIPPSVLESMQAHQQRMAELGMGGGRILPMEDDIDGSVINVPNGEGER